MEIILGGIVKFVSVLIVSYILGVFQTTMICIISYIPLRHFGGGVHLSTYYRCLTVGLIMFILLGKLATWQANIIFLYIIIYMIFFMGIYIIVRWVPARIDEKAITDKDEKIKQKKKSLIILTLLCLGNIIFIKLNLLNYAFASTLGVMVSLFFITPWGYGVIIMLDNILNKI